MNDESLDDPFGENLRQTDCDIPETLPLASSILPSSFNLVDDVSSTATNNNDDFESLCSSPLSKRPRSVNEDPNQADGDIPETLPMASSLLPASFIPDDPSPTAAEMLPLTSSLLPASFIPDDASSTVTNNNGEPERLFSSPIRRRPKCVIKHLSSSSLKKRIKKSSNCRFCIRNKTRESLEQHLNDSEVCYNLYCRMLKVRSIDAVLLKLFPCLGCDKDGNFKLALHLSKSPSCFEKYKDRFGGQDTKEISKRIKNITRQSNKSRQSLSRKIENVKAKDFRAETKTVTEAINGFKTSTALSNYKRCIRCSGNFLDSATKEVDLSSIENEEEIALLRPEFKRMNKFFMCHICSGGRTSEQVGSQSNIFTAEVKNGTKILKPSNDNPLPTFEVSGREQVLIPTNLGSLKIFERKKLDQPSNIRRILYNCEKPSVEDFSSLYVDRLLKFKHRKDFFDRVLGTICDDRQRVLSSIKPIIDTSSIHASEHWEEAKRNANKFRFRQHGPVSIGFRIVTDPSDIETIATCLVIEGKVITVTFEGDEGFDLKTKYYLHPHNSSEECLGESCQKQDLEEILEGSQIETFNPRYSSTYICSVYQKTHALVENLIKTKSVDLYSEDYFVGVNFNSKGNAIIEGSLWTPPCDSLNEALGCSSLAGADLNTKDEPFLEFINKSIFTTMSPRILKDKLNITDDKANDLGLIVATNQMDLQSIPQVLGLESAFVESPSVDAESNIAASKEFTRMIQELLMVLSDEEKLDFPLPQWLADQVDKFEIETNEEVVVLKHGIQELLFKKEERLVNLMQRLGVLQGIYQYSTTCSDKVGGIVLKGEQVSNLFTRPYNPTLMRSFKCKMDVFPVNGFTDWAAKTDLLPMDNPEHDESLNVHDETHRTGSVIELYALADAKKIQDIYSSPSEFVDCSEEGDQKFKKVKEETAESYKMEGSDGFFEILSSNIQRHQLRMNGKHLLLAESCINYDFVGKKKSEELFDIFGKNLSKIPQTDVQSIYDNMNGEKVMPEYILCSNRHALKIRRKRKILQYHEFLDGSKEFRRNKVLLFFPLEPGSLLTREIIGEELKIFMNCFES